MKKALLSFSVIVSSLMFASAQISGSINFGTNGGSVAIGQNVNTNTAVGGSLINLIALVQNIVARLIPLGIGMAVAALFFGIIMFMVKGRDEKERENWLHWMMYSVLGLFVMVAIWGLVGFLASVLGIGVGGSAPVPSIPYAQ